MPIDQSQNHGYMQEVAVMPQSVLEMTKDLVLAEIQAGSLSPDEMQGTLHHIYQSMLTLKSREESETLVSASMAERPQALVDWRTSITRHAITCLECGQTFKQLSGRHLRLHGLDARSYRRKYGIPSTQPLTARETAAKQRQIAAEVRPWEKSPMYMKAQEERAAAAKTSGRKKGKQKG
jgi:predicted transcriptional regulator